MLIRLINNLRFVLNHPFNKGRLLSTLKRYMGWQISSRLAPGPIIVPWVNGAKLIARHGETGVTGNVYCGLHEFEDMAFLLHALRPDELFVDIGANSGSYTMLACAALDGRGLSIEPVPATFERLRMNIGLNGLGKKVRALNIGLADKAGFLYFSSSQDTTNHVVVDAGGSEDTIRVEIKILDEIIHGEFPSVIKVDAEGYELPILRGATAVLSNPELHSVILELNGSGARYGHDEGEVTRLMAEFGFGIYSYDPRERELSVLAAPNKEGNTLFVRDRARVGRLVADAPVFSLFGRQW